MSQNISARHDPFLHFVSRIAHTAYNYRRIIFLASIIIAICILGFLGWNYYNKGQEKRASDVYFLGQQAYEKVEAKKLEELQSGLKKDKKSNESKSSPSDSKEEIGISAYAQAILHWENTASRFPSTASGSLAMMQLGNIYFRHEEFEKSLSYFKKAENSLSDELLKILVYYDMAQNLEALHRFKEAMGYYEKLTAYDMEFVSQEAYLGVARCYEALSEFDKAKQAYESFAKKFPNSAFLKSEIESQKFLLEQFSDEYKKYFAKVKK